MFYIYYIMFYCFILLFYFITLLSFYFLIFRLIFNQKTRKQSLPTKRYSNTITHQKQFHIVRSRSKSSPASSPQPSNATNLQTSLFMARQAQAKHSPPFIPPPP